VIEIAPTRRRGRSNETIAAHGIRIVDEHSTAITHRSKGSLASSVNCDCSHRHRVPAGQPPPGARSGLAAARVRARALLDRVGYSAKVRSGAAPNLPEPGRGPSEPNAAMPARIRANCAEMNVQNRAKNALFNGVADYSRSPSTLLSPPRRHIEPDQPTRVADATALSIRSENSSTSPQAGTAADIRSAATPWDCRHKFEAPVMVSHGG